MSDAATPPSPDGLPILGNGYAFARDPVGAMERWATHGEVVRLTMPGRSIHMVTDPDLIARILVEDQASYTIGPAQREFFSDVEDHAVTTTTGDRWRRLRRALHPAFTRERIRAYADDVAATTARVLEAWDDGERIDLLEQHRLLTVNALGDTLLSADLRGQEDVVMEAADALIDRANFRRPGQLLPDWIPTPTDRRFERAVRALDAFVDDLLAERRQSVGDDGPDDERSDGPDDVCSVLLAAHDRGDLSMPELRHNLVGLLLAGHDSPATALTTAWYALGDRPDLRQALRAEYDRVVDGGRPGADAVDDLEVTRRVVDEALRLYPPTAAVNRASTERVTLGGYEFEPGTQFMLPQWVLHRDERFWTDPERFDPSRWEGESDRPEYAYFPFSGGPRQCIGSDFARQELVVALATTVGRLDLAIEREAPLSFTPSIQLRPQQPIMATVHRR